MKEAADKYGKTKKMGEDTIKELVKDAQGSWKHFSKHLGQ
jgi:Tfp pilus assembly protein PilP